MKSFHVITLVASLCLVILGCTEANIVGPNSHESIDLSVPSSMNGVDVIRPFSGRYDTTPIRITEGCAEGFLTAEFDLAGTATYLGEFSAATVDCLNLVPISFDPLVLEFIEGEGTLTASNGDKLYIEYAGTVTLVDDGPDIIQYNGPITGGTGRFAGVSGNLSFRADGVDVNGNGLNSQLNGSIEGTIISSDY